MSLNPRPQTWCLVSGPYPTQGTPRSDYTLALTTPSAITSLNPAYSPNIRPSPQLTLSPLPVVSPLHSLAVVNLPSSASRRISPSPVQAMLVATLQIHPIVSMGPELYHSKLHYDVSKDPHTAAVSTFGVTTSISIEQKNFPVVGGALVHTAFEIVFNHPILINTIKCDTSLTVGELVKHLYSHFHKRVGAGEMSSIEQDADLYTAAVKHQNKRCQAMFDVGAEWNKGMKRIDVLGKECKFRGLELDATSAHDRLLLRVTFGK